MNLYFVHFFFTTEHNTNSIDKSIARNKAQKLLSRKKNENTRKNSELSLSILKKTKPRPLTETKIEQ